jgi:hypothetical protein
VIDDVSYQIYINNNKLFNHISYKTISSFIELNTGRQHVIVKNKNNIVIDFDILLLAGYSYTLVLIGESNNITPLLLDDDIECQGDDYVYIRFIHAAYNIPSIDIAIDQDLYENFNYKDTHVLNIPKKHKGTTSTTINLSLINKKYKFNTYPMYVKFGGIYTVVLSGTIDNLFILTKEDIQRHCY